MTDPAGDDRGPTLAQLLVSVETRALTDEEALFVLSLIQDGRSVPEHLSALAREHSDAHPAIAEALGDFGLISEVFRSEAAEPASAGFTGEIVSRAREVSTAEAALSDGPRATHEVLRETLQAPSLLSFQLARRMAVAAALLLSLTLSFDALRPTPAAADPAVEQQFYRGDVFRPDPYGPPALDIGLAELLPGRLDQATGVATDPANVPDLQTELSDDGEGPARGNDR